MDGEAVRFCTDNQCVSLHPQEVDSVAMAPAAPKIPRLVQATPAFMAVTLVFSLVTLFVVGKPPGDPNLTNFLSFQHKVPRGPRCTLSGPLCSQKDHSTSSSRPKPQLPWEQIKATVQGGASQELRFMRETLGGSLLLSPRFWNSTSVWDSVSSQAQGWGFADLEKWNVSVQQQTRPVPKPVQAVILGDNITGHLPFEPNNHHHFGREAEMRELIQTFKGHMENSSAWVVEIQMLKCRVDNVNSQLQVLGDHLGNTNADIQMVKGVLKDATTLSLQTQMLRSSLEGTNAEIQRLKEDLEKADALTFQTLNFLKSSLENTSIELHVLSRGLENANSEIQMLNASLETANTQAQLANSSLKNANAEIYVLRGHLDSVNDLRTQNQVLRNSLEGANAEIQGLKENLQNTNALNSQTQAFIKSSFDNTSAEIQFLRGHLERAGDEIHVLKRDLKMVTAQTQKANGRLDQTDTQIQVFKSEMENVNTLNAQIQVLNGHMKNASREIQTLKQGMKNASALTSQTQMLDSNLQKASAEIQRLRGDLENTKALTMEIQQEQSRLKTLHVVITSQEQLQRTQSQLLQMVLQGWKFNGGSLYYFSSVKKSWHEAEQFCVSQGAHLASVASKEEQAFLVEFTSKVYYWIGLTDRGTEGSWRWTDGTPFNAAQNKAATRG
ncbi:C-type lectin domain family 4 member F isoform X4 [Homo sapiens]|uniref:C-type lectin domain family 4 member F isoform X4 n=1 Tax=Homo sapiens TaxID=9606 RepID=UPI0005CFF332|nr:C-type lectin domain family 4 member F isoform X4 [Homo sapiens]|eukprot:XP_011530942.1 C-type lectin domain family 4 member F isoform X4 [Homo sapiens]